MRISVDASYADGVAAVAAVINGRDDRLLFSDVVYVDGSAAAEAIAVTKAMEIAERAGWRNVLFRSDHLKKFPRDVPRDFNWSLQCIPREHNVTAHTVAKQTLKVWRAGSRGEPTLVL